MKLRDGLYIEDAGAVDVFHTSKSLRLPNEKNITVFVELTSDAAGINIKLPRPENSPGNFICVFLLINSEELNVLIDSGYLRSDADITLDEPGDYVLLWSDGLQWDVLNYNWS